MQILVNGVSTTLPGPGPVSALLTTLSLQGRRLAVELNGEIVPRSAWDETPVAEGDRVEIIHAVGGG